MTEQKQSIAMKFYYLEHWFHLHGMTFFAQIAYHLMQVLLGCTIPPSAELEGVTISHFHGIVIHSCSRIGKGTIVYQHVTLGGRNGKVAPVVGENCVLGAGCCLLGDIRIGNNVHIGANAVVLEDIPDNCTVIGVPGKIVRKD